MEDEFYTSNPDYNEVRAGMSCLYDLSVALYSFPPTQRLGEALVEWACIWLRFNVDHDILTKEEADHIVEEVAGPDPREVATEPSMPAEFDGTPMSSDEVLDMLRDIESL